MAESQISDGTSKLTAEGRTDWVDEYGDIGLKFGQDSCEGRGRTVAEEMVFILVYWVTESTKSKEICLRGGQASGLSAIRADPHLIP